MYRKEKMSRKPNTLQALISLGLQQPRPFFLLCKIDKCKSEKAKSRVALDFTMFSATIPVFLIM